MVLDYNNAPMTRLETKKKEELISDEKYNGAEEKGESKSTMNYTV